MNNIVIKEDKSYLSEIDLQAIQKNIAKLGIYTIRLERNLTEKQMQENSLLADSLNEDEWEDHCRQIKIQIGKQIEKIVDAIHEKFLIYQYKDKSVSFSNDDWDLFFWSNMGDMSYVRLNPNRKRTNKQQMEDIKKVIALVKTIDCKGIKLSIQYTAHYDNNKVNELVKQVYNKVKDGFVNYEGVEGRIKEVGKNLDGQTSYGFFKKRARNRYYNVSSDWFLQQAFSQNQI